MIVLVAMIVLVVVVDDGGSGFDGIGFVLCLPLFHIFRSSIYFKQCCKMMIDKKTKKQQKQLKNVLYRLHPHSTLSDGLRKGNALLHLCQLFYDFF